MGENRDKYSGKRKDKGVVCPRLRKSEKLMGL
jgi:hypothetical protein